MKKTWAGKSRDYRDRFQNAPSSKRFLSTLERKAGIFKFLRFEERFGKARFL